MKTENGRIVKVDYYQADALPDGLKEIAKKQGFKAEGLIAVKTLIASPPTYQFEKIGNSVDKIIDYMHNVARNDGVDLDRAINKALGDENL